MDGRDALPRSASARAARPCRGAVGSRGERPPSQVLRDHVAGPGAARRGTQAVASGGRDAPRHLARAGPRVGRPPDVGRADRHREREDARSGERGIARGADRPVAELPPPPAGDPLRRRRRVGGPPARAGRGAVRRGARHRRGVPGRGEAHGRPRRPLAGVRARALGPPLEATGGVARRRRGAEGGDADRRGRRVLARGGGGRRGQGAGALRPRPGRGRRVLRPQREPLRPARC